MMTNYTKNESLSKVPRVLHELHIHVFYMNYFIFISSQIAQITL